MRALPAEEKAKIEQLTEGLKLEKSKLERELTKWDESGNDIIILAKKMCMMMMEMSDFTRCVRCKGEHQHSLKLRNVRFDQNNAPYRQTWRLLHLPIILSVQKL